MRNWLLVAIVLVLLLTLPQNAFAACSYSCDQGYDTAKCWLWVSGNLANMTSCNEVCDCMGGDCRCWCAGQSCYWT